MAVEIGRDDFKLKYTSLLAKVDPVMRRLGGICGGQRIGLKPRSLQVHARFGC